jgi:hypothetical protein
MMIMIMMMVLIEPQDTSTLRRGRAEAARLLLVDNSIPFVDDRPSRVWHAPLIII